MRIGLFLKMLLHLTSACKFDNPIVHENFTELLWKVMQEDPGTWDTLCYFDEIKDRHPGFNYRVKLDSHGHPEALMGMFPQQRHNLLRFGHTLFLDGQNRQCNTYGWLYIGPVVKNAELMV